MRAIGLRERVERLDWERIRAALDERGFATTGPLLGADECAALCGLYDTRDAFRSRVVMARHGFGRGEYQYFSYPLPVAIQELREALYPHLAKVADGWNEALAREARYPRTLAAYLRQCHAAGQKRPTPLLLKYAAGDYNCLHQDLYGEWVFPLQATILLSAPGMDFSGGEFVLVEQRPRMQSRPQVVPLAQGEAVVFAVNERPVRGTRGVHRVRMRHGVSEVASGTRFTAGVIFHDAA